MIKLNSIIKACSFGETSYYQIVYINPNEGYIKYKSLIRKKINTFKNEFIFKANINSDGTVKLNNMLIGYLI